MSNRGLVDTPLRRAPLAEQSLFQEDWWLEASSAGRFDKTELIWDGLKVASLAYAVKKNFGYRSLSMPPYTRTLGPVLSLPPAKPARYAANMCRAASELAEKLPACQQFFQRLDPMDETSLAFSLAGFTLLQDFTFRIEPDQRLDHVFDDIDGRTRRLIRATGDRLHIDAHIDLDRFTALSYRDRPKGENGHDFSTIQRIFETCLLHNRTIILSAVDETGKDEASVILVWGANTLYYWLPARDRALSNGGSNAFLLWEAIKFAHQRGLTFDFDGFGSPKTARFLLHFGVRPVSRIGLLKATTIGHLHRFVYSALHRHRPF